MASKVPALIDWLVAAFTAAPTLGAAPAPNTVTVYDGPPTTSLDPFLKLFVGLTDPNSSAPEVAGRFTQARSDMGAAMRDEVSEIFCAAEAWSGTDGLQVVRVSANGILAAVENLVRSDTTRFGGNAALAAPGITNGEWVQDNTQQGAVARVLFSIAFKSFT